MQYYYGSVRWSDCVQTEPRNYDTTEQGKKCVMQSFIIAKHLKVRRSLGSPSDKITDIKKG